MAIVSLERNSAIQELPSVVSVLRHGKKKGSGGPLTLDGWEAAVQRGRRIGRDAARRGIQTIFIGSGDVHRTQQTARALASGAHPEYISTRRDVPIEPPVRVTSPERVLSLSSIASADSELVNGYRQRIAGARAVLDDLPWYIASLSHLIRYPNLEKAEQKASGKFLIEWIELDKARLKHVDGTPDTKTKSAREIARDQAVLLRDLFAQAIQSSLYGKPIDIVECTHENMVLVDLRYFLFQGKAQKNRRSVSQAESGLSIIKKAGGRIPYLSGIDFHFYQLENGKIQVRAKFNNKWYEVNMSLIEALAEEAKDSCLSDVFAHASHADVRHTREEALQRQAMRERIYVQSGLAA